MAMKSKKEKIKIMGKQYKVEKPISETMKAMSESLRSHEVALLTWVHKDYAGNKRFTQKDVNGFRDSLNEYCLQIPEAKNILKRMEELDAQVEEDIKGVNELLDDIDDIITTIDNFHKESKFSPNF